MERLCCSGSQDMISSGQSCRTQPNFMFSRPSTGRGVDEFVPNVCTRAPVSGKAFCKDHCQLLEKSQVPTGLRPFIKFCGADPAMQARLKLVCKEDEAQQSVTDIQGTRILYENLDLQVRVAFYYFLCKR